MDDILKTKEAAEYLKVGEAYIRQLIRLKKLRAYREGRRGGYRILKEDLNKVEAYHRDLCKTYYPPIEYRNIESFRKQFGYEYGYVLTKDNKWLVFEN